jgi:hypothetical protein
VKRREDIGRSDERFGCIRQAYEGPAAAFPSGRLITGCCDGLLPLRRRRR